MSYNVMLSTSMFHSGGIYQNSNLSSIDNQHNVRSFFLSSCKCILLKVFRSRRKLRSQWDHRRFYTAYIHMSGTSLGLLTIKKVNLTSSGLKWLDIYPAHLSLFCFLSKNYSEIIFSTNPKTCK